LDYLPSIGSGRRVTQNLNTLHRAGLPASLLIGTSRVGVEQSYLLTSVV